MNLLMDFPQLLSPVNQGLIAMGLSLFLMGFFRQAPAYRLVHVGLVGILTFLVINLCVGNMHAEVWAYKLESSMVLISLLIVIPASILFYIRKMNLPGECKEAKALLCFLYHPTRVVAARFWKLMVGARIG
ncbi:MAG: hypothetical protein AAGI38_06095 [Bacteroidota bacterium]